jgi:hypothetical protein
MNDFKAGELVRIGVTGLIGVRRNFGKSPVLGKLGLFMGYDDPNHPNPYARVLIDRNEYVLDPEGLEKVQ